MAESAVAFQNDDENGVFGIDVSGWVEQNRSREAYEVVREPIQNALDTGSDIYVRIDYGDQSVTVEGHGSGVDDLSQFYDLFAGDKQFDPEKRGRFGRGVKEFIGANDETVISSTGGGLKFSIDAEYDAEIDENVVDAARHLYPDARREEGTVVYGTNEDWSESDFEDVEGFVDRLWMPEDQDLYLEVYDGGEGARQATVTHDRPDAVLEQQYLPTLVVEDGFQETEKRRTDIDVKRTVPGEGGVFELGIPVTSGESFPFFFNVHQKTPVTERRNELDNSYRSDLMESLIDERLDLFDDEELAEDYVTQYISRFSYKMSSSTQREYVKRRFETDPDELLVYTNDTPPIALTWAMQRQLPMENIDEYGTNVGGILEQQCPTVQEWYDGQRNDRSIEVIDDLAPGQESFLDYVESELADRSQVSEVDFELAYISEEIQDGQTHAIYSPGDETVYLNAFADEWNEPTPDRIGTVLHELGHHETDAWEEGHGPDWYHTVEELSGNVIRSSEDELGNPSMDDQ